MTDWKAIWDRKGKEDTTDLKQLDGFEKTSIDMKKVAEFIIGRMEIKPSHRVLELGCGAGFLAQHIAPHCKYIGVDMTESLIKKHIKLLGNSVLLAEADDIPFKDNYFDMSISYSVFHYFPDKEYFNKVMKELLRVTKRRIFIGDLPLESNDISHLLYALSDFRSYSVIATNKGCSNKNRFSIMVDIGVKDGIN